MMLGALPLQYDSMADLHGVPPQSVDRAVIECVWSLRTDILWVCEMSRVVESETHISARLDQHGSRSRDDGL